MLRSKSNQCQGYYKAYHSLGLTIYRISIHRPPSKHVHCETSISDVNCKQKHHFIFNRRQSFSDTVRQEHRSKRRPRSRQQRPTNKLVGETRESVDDGTLTVKRSPIVETTTITLYVETKQSKFSERSSLKLFRNIDKNYLSELVHQTGEVVIIVEEEEEVPF